jgi:adenine-specific DNA-methyltransferase
MPRSEKLNASYKNPDDDPRGPWTSGDLSARNFYGAGTYPIECPSGRIIVGPPNGMYWRVSKEKFSEMNKDARIWWGKDGNNTPRIKRFLKEVKQGVVPQTMWMNSEVGNTQEAKKEVVAIFGAENFMTPKPERLLSRIISVATNPGDLVLDSFLGSGTTAAVAHKMNRRYIGIEMGEHALTHCALRLRKVIDGEQGGISKSMNWKGGGGFRFHRLGEPVFDAEGRIRGAIRFPILAAHVWFSETGTPWNGKGKSPLLGFHGERANALLYNGILGDKTPKGGNVVTRETLGIIREKIDKRWPGFNGPLTIYGEASHLSNTTLARQRIAFKQTPYEIKARP